jgi:hypothetical protein
MAQVTRRTIRSPWSTGIPEYVWRHQANIAAHNVMRQLPTRRATQVLRTGTESASGHSRRYCHVRSLVRYPWHRTLPRPTRPVCLSPSCFRSAKNRHSRRSSCVLASLDLATRDARAATKDRASRLQRTCAEPAARVLGLIFFGSQFSEGPRRNGGEPTADRAMAG